MQKWEYKEYVEWGFHAQNTEEYLNKLGEEGWELCGYQVFMAFGLQKHYLLKRPTQESDRS